MPTVSTSLLALVEITSAVSAGVTMGFVLLVRLAWRRRKPLREP